MALVHGFIYDVLLLFFIVLLHEIGHAYTALALGWRVKKIELLPFGGVVEVEEHGNRPTNEEILVVSAGPLMNIMMICIGFICLYFHVGSEKVVYQFLEYNLIILLFNLLPIWPLDGGKFLQILFSLFLPYRMAMKYSLLISSIFFITYVLLVAFFFSIYFSLWIVAIFLCVAQWIEFRQAPYQFLRFIMKRYQQVKDLDQEAELDVVSIALYPTQSVQAALEKMYRHKSHYYCLLNKSGNIAHVISEKEMLEQYFKHHHTYRAVGEIFG